MPSDQLHSKLTEHEKFELENLPFRYLNNNRHEIKTKIDCHVSSAINRYLWKTRLRAFTENLIYGLRNVIEDKESELWMCRCGNCNKARTDLNNILGEF
jgi:hypothetical protein